MNKGAVLVATLFNARIVLDSQSSWGNGSGLSRNIATFYAIFNGRVLQTTRISLRHHTDTNNMSPIDSPIIVGTRQSIWSVIVVVTEKDRL